jgi:uncharacterized protein YkwD
MQGRAHARRISIVLAVITLSIAVGASFTLATQRERGAVSNIAVSRAPVLSDDDAQLFAWLRAERHAAAVSKLQRKQWYEAVRGPTFEQVLVFFDVLLSSEPHQATYQPEPPPEAWFAAANVPEPTVAPAQPTAAPATPPAARRAGTADQPPASPAPAPTQTPVPPPPAPPPPPPPPPQPPAPPAAADVWTDPGFTQIVWDGVNARRTRGGLAPVAADARLTRAAMDYAVLMSETGWFSHTGPDGSSFVDRIVAAGFPFEGQVGEILAMGTNGWPAPEVVQAWMDSPGHRDQIMTGAYTVAGLACAFTRESGSVTVRCAMNFAT